MPATPSPNYADKQLLATDATFQSRVKQALLAACSSIKNEGWAVAFHRERETYVGGIMQQPDTYKPIFANVVANEAFVAFVASQGLASFTNDSGNGWTQTNAQVQSGSGTSNRGVSEGDQVNSGVGTKTYAPTLGTSAFWSAFIVGFKPDQLMGQIWT